MFHRRTRLIWSIGAVAAAALLTVVQLADFSVAGPVLVRNALAAASSAGPDTAGPALGPATNDAGDPQDTVYVVDRSGAGYSVSIYDPAPGVTPDRLRASLRAQGHRALAKGVRPSDVLRGSTTTGSPAAPVAGAAAACLTSNTARQWCDHVWAYNSFNDPQVYFIDYTSPAWPVSSAVPVWNRAVGIDSYYRWHTQGCPGGGRHCVWVYSANYGPVRWIGATTWAPDASGSYGNVTNVTVQFNDYYGGTAAEHRNTACHELGHALGLDHNTSVYSCLYASRTSVQTPNGDDFALLPLIYPKPGT
jgi:hypothetical protein